MILDNIVLEGNSKTPAIKDKSNGILQSITSNGLIIVGGISTIIFGGYYFGDIIAEVIEPSTTEVFAGIVQYCWTSLIGVSVCKEGYDTIKVLHKFNRGNHEWKCARTTNRT